MLKPGDAIMLTRPDGKWDVFTVDATGESEPRLCELTTETIAYEVAHTALRPGGRVWLCCHSTPDRIDEYCRVR
jgi:hypothetical protein